MSWAGIFDFCNGAGLVINLDYKGCKVANQAAGIVVGHIGTSAVTTQELLNLN